MKIKAVQSILFVIAYREMRVTSRQYIERKIEKEMPRIISYIRDLCNK